MNYLSVCSGIEAATVAWHQMGWNPLGFSEIEKFPSEVLKHHYPHVPNLGDMTKYKEWDFGTNRLDLLVGGTPCQSFSVAGLRKGLEDPRGNLALVYCGILDHFRPKWFVWENVPGVLSSNGGRDFGAFLGAVVELGYGFSYRVLDAQYFGVAQRRRRVFVVGHLGDWKPAAEVLFESESLSRNTKKSRKEGQEIANCLTKSPSSHSSYNPARSEGNAVVVDWPADKATTLNASFGDKLGLENQHINSGASLFVPYPYDKVGTLLARDHKGIDSFDHSKIVLEAYCGDLAPTLTASAAGISRVGNDYTADSQYIVQQAFRKSRRAQSVDDFETWVDDGKANTLNAFDVGDVRTTHAIALAENTIGRQPMNGGNGNGFTEGGPMYTLNATGVHGVAYGFEPGIAKREGEPNRFVEERTPTLRANMGDNQTAVAIGVDTYNLTENTTTTQTLRGFGHIDHVGGVIQPITAPTLTTNNPSRSSQSSEVTNQIAAVYAANMAVRRLTPVECERLQGFPDSYTNIKSNCPDGPRYKALGNSMAVPCMKWIGERINVVNNKL